MRAIRIIIALPIFFAAMVQAGLQMNFLPDGTNAVLRWEGERGSSYELRAADDLAPGLWTPLHALPLYGSNADMAFTNVASSPAGFFRLDASMGPVTTFMWSRWLWPSLSPEQMLDWNVSRIWQNGGIASTASNLQANGMDVQGQWTFAGLNDNRYRQPEYEPFFPRTFISSFPETAPSNGVFQIPLLNGYSTNEYLLEEDAFFQAYWKVWDRTAGAAVPSQEWVYADGILTLHTAHAGHEYSAGFSVRDLSGMPDMWSPAFRELYTSDWIGLPESQPNIARITYFAFYFKNLYMPTGRFLDWYGPGHVLGRSFIEQYENRYGKPFDLDTLFDLGVPRSTNDQRHEGYREVQSLQREVTQSYAPDFNQTLHEEGRKVRFFWGDCWVGIEPSDVGFAALGFDEIVTAVSSPSDVRRLMTVDPSIQRNNRIGFWGVQTGNGLARFDDDWYAFLRAALRDFPEGISLGGPELTTLLKDEPGFAATMQARFAQFRQLHALIHGEKAYANLKVGILNAYGALRAWPRVFTMNDSVQLWNGLADLPVEVEWLSFDDIIARGVPADLDVLVNNGEPNSAWSGGTEWSPAVVQAVEDYVANGGAFIGIDAPGVKGSMGSLSNLLGLAYLGTVSPNAAAGVFNEVDLYRRFLTSYPGAVSVPMELNPSFAQTLGCSATLGSVTINSVQLLAGAEELSASMRWLDEPFSDYPAGMLGNSDANAEWYAGPWANAASGATIESGELKLAVNPGSPMRRMANPAAGTVYASVRIKQELADGSGGIKVDFRNSASNVLFNVQLNGNQAQFKNVGSSGQGSTPVSNGGWVTLVVRREDNGTGQSMFTAWVDPSSEADAPVWVDTRNFPVGGSAVDHVLLSVWGLQETEHGRVDKLCIGSVWHEVQDLGGVATVSRHSFGSGSAWYLRGVPKDEAGYDFFKRLLYESAGRGKDRRLLDCPTLGGFVYWYPCKRILLAYNQEAATSTLALDLAALGGAGGSIQFEAITTNAASFAVASDWLKTNPLEVEVLPGEVATWRIDW